MTSLWTTWPLVTALALGGCATAGPRVSVVGRPVEVRLQSTKDAPGAPVTGELLAVSAEKVWVFGPQKVSTLPLREVEDLRIQQHGLNGRRAWRWVALGALASGVALAVACSTVEGNNACGKVFVPVLLSWGAVGIPSARGLAESSQLRVKPSDWEALRRYARFPQGLPEGLDPESLTPASQTSKP